VFDVHAAAPYAEPVLPATVPIRRLSFDDVLAMEQSGILADDDRLELVDGVLVEMLPVGASHDRVVSRLTRHFARGVPDELEVRIQSVLRTSWNDGYLLPDVTVFERRADGEQPDTALLVVEVAQTSQQRDLEKAAAYARCGVQQYWIVDLVQRAVLVFTHPRRSRFALVDEHRAGLLQPPLEAPPVDVAALLSANAG
jgi:Uma2 family endonuclease